MLTAAIDPIFQWANRAEAVLWFTIGIGFGVVAARRRGRVRWRTAVAAVLFIAFGASDLVETQTGAWWTPWWLLAWKAACVVGLVALLIEHHSHRRTARKTVPDGNI